MKVVYKWNTLPLDYPGMEKIVQTTRLGNMVLKALASLLAVLLLAVGVPTAATAAGVPVKGTYSDAQIEEALAYSQRLISAGAISLNADYSQGAISGGTDANPTVVTEGVFDAALSYRASELNTELVQANRPYANNERRLIVGFEATGAEVGLNLDFAGALAQLRGITGIFPVDGHPGLLEVVFVDDLTALSTPDDTFGGEGFDFTAEMTVTDEVVGKSEVNWSGKGTPSTILLITSDAEKLELNEKKQTKTVPNGDLSRFITSTFNKAAGLTELVIDKPGLLAEVFTFTVERETVAGGTVTFVDEIDSTWMDYTGSSVSLTTKTWDEIKYGYITGQPTTTAFSLSPTYTGVAGSRSFTTSAQVPANSLVTLTYEMRIRPDQIDNLITEIKAKHDAVTSNGEIFGAVSTNTATVKAGGVTTTADAKVKAQGTAYSPPRPNPGMSKSVKDASVFAGTKFFEFKSPGSKELATPIPVVYQFGMNLTSYNPALKDDPRNFGINSPVLFSDTLPDGTTWDITGPLVINGVTFNSAGTGTPNSANQYTIDAAKRKLTINFGATDVYKNWTFEAPAIISSLEGATQTTEAHDYLKYVHTNRAGAQFTSGNNSAQQTPNAFTSVNLWDRNETDSNNQVRPVDNEDIFSKKAKSSLVTATPGQSTKVSYDFVVQRGEFDQEIDIRSTEIVDFVDTDVFNMDTLSNVEVSAKYNDSESLEQSDFDLSWDPGTSALTIELNPSGEAKVGDGSKKLQLTLTLTTQVIKAGQVLQIDNSAEYHGKRANPGVYQSTTASSASSSGAGTFYSKAAYDWPNSVFSKNLRVEHDGNGAPVDSRYTDNGYLYRVALVVPANYRGLLPTLEDTLAEGNLSFEGFVEDPTKPTVTTAANEIDLGRGVYAQYANGKVEILARGGIIAATGAQGKTVFWAYYLAKPKSSLQDVSVINTISNARAAVTVTNEFPITVTKVDSSGNNKSITDLDARFTVLDKDNSNTILPSGNQVVTVQDGQLVILDTVTQAIKPLMVPTAGNYFVQETVAPDGFYLTTTKAEVSVDANGLTEEVVFTNDPVKAEEQVSISKAFDGQNPAGKQYHFEWTAQVPAPYVAVTCGPDDSNTAAVDEYVSCASEARAAGKVVANGTTTVLGGATQVIGNFPTGTEIEITEVQFLPSAGYDFVGVLFTGTPGTQNGSGTNASYTFEVDGSKAIALTATNKFTPYVSVGDYVWLDVNRDGIQNEPLVNAIPGVKLVISWVGNDGNPVHGGVVSDIFGSPVQPQVTDSKGWYNFTNLPVTGSDTKYKVSIDMTDPDTQAALSRYAATKPGVGDRRTDSSTLSAVSTNLPNGGSKDLTLDFGFVTKSYAVGDVVWIDTDRDGVQDSNEAKLAGVTVSITDVAGNPVTNVLGAVVPSVTTDENGLYKFDNLPAGEYVVTFKLTAQQNETYMFTKNVSGDSDSSNNSDGVVKTATDSSGTVTTVPDTAITRTIVLGDSNDQLTTSYLPSTIVATEGIDPTWDAGVHLKNVSIGNFVWVDEDRDGLQDSGEPGIPGVTLEVVRVGTDNKEYPVSDVRGVPVVDQITDSKGIYNFVDLPALQSGEKYVVRIVKNADTLAALDPYLPTLPGVGTDDSIDSNTDFAEATHAGLQEDNGHNPTLDFGFITKSYAVGDVVWIDANRDGVQDLAGSSPELPLEGVTVELFVEHTDKDTGNKSMVPAVDVLGKPVGERITDANGRYLFDNLPTGTYEVKYTLSETQSNVYMFTSPTVTTAQTPGATVANDSNAHVPTVAPGDPAPVRTSGTSQQFVLNDASVVDKTAYTDQAFTATQGIDPTWDAGVHLKKVSVGDRVWVDQDRDGIQDTDSSGNYTEPGIPGVVLEIVRVDKNGKEHPVTDVDGDPVGQETTGPDGDYEFSDLPALDDNESYKVTIVTTDPSTQTALAPYVPTLPGEGTDRGANSSTGSELAPADGLQTDGAKDDTLDFGFVVPSYAVGDRVWIDVDRDGIQDAGEVDLAGVTVTLLDASTGLPVAEDILGKTIKPQVTGKDGLYMFDNLPAGSYKVQFELTAKQGEKYQFTTNVAGANSVDNSDGVVGTNPLVATTGVIVLDATNAALDTEYSVKHLASQGVDPTWDAGVHLKKVSVGDYVWFDADQDGVQDGNEKGIKDVLLYLTDKNGKPVVDVYGNEVEPVRTDANGKYTFENLPALADGEQYIVVIDETDAATEQALLGLMPTLEGKGTPEMDSSSWFAIATFDGLTLDGDRNPTLDFGFVIDPDFDAFGEEETRDETEDGSGSAGSDGDKDLPDTGFGGLAAGVIAALMLAAGALLVAMRRRV